MVNHQISVTLEFHEAGIIAVLSLRMVSADVCVCVPKIRTILTQYEISVLLVFQPKAAVLRDEVTCSPFFRPLVS